MFKMFYLSNLHRTSYMQHSSLSVFEIFEVDVQVNLV
jgi:hypothetical protein